MADGKPGRPATGQVPGRSIRIGATWDEAKAAADADGERFAAFVERALRHELDRRARRLAREQT
ncbi:hypothetical protein ACQP2C_32405 [Micromonospora zamorensis]|uniref:hypothetical protein n=1 Tax=Micromonospora zamorensis TaxID=709883 RepID=UPI003D952A8A